MYTGYFATIEEAEAYLRSKDFTATDKGIWYYNSYFSVIVSETPYGVLLEVIK